MHVERESPSARGRSTAPSRRRPFQFRLVENYNPLAAAAPFLRFGSFVPSFRQLPRAPQSISPFTSNEVTKSKSQPRQCPSVRASSIPLRRAALPPDDGWPLMARGGGGGGGSGACGVIPRHEYEVNLFREGERGERGRRRRRRATRLFAHLDLAK